MLLQCKLSSNLATPRWTLNGRELRGLGLTSGYRLGPDGLLILGAQAQHSGSYRCFATENSVSVLLRLYSVSVHSESLQPPAAPTADGQPPAASSHPPLTTGGTTEPLPSLAWTGSPPDDLQTSRWLEVLSLPLLAMLGGLCLVLTMVLIYISFCSSRASGRRKLSKQLSLQVLGAPERESSSYLELRTISSYCNGRQDRRSLSGPSFDSLSDGFFPALPGSRSPPPAPPPLPMAPPLPSVDYADELSSTLPCVLRRMNVGGGGSGSCMPLYHSFTEELSRILEQRNHSQLDLLTEQSSV